MSFSPADLAQLADHGLSPGEAERQLAQLRGGQQWTRLARPCTRGDGIRQIPAARQDTLLARFMAAAAEGRVTRFVPASGAATRMFQPLQVTAGDGCELEHFLSAYELFPFATVLSAELTRHGCDPEAARRAADLPRLLSALLEPGGLDYAHLPKALLPFHRLDGETRTAFVEHLAETAQLVGPGNQARLHFTVSPEHQPLFARHLASWQGLLERRYGCHFAITFSVQQSATDTLALGPDGQPLRDADGRLLLRPGGHGALLANLAGLEGDVILIRNIDNVVPDRRKADNLLWDRLLGGLLLELVDSQRALLALLECRPGDAETCLRARAFLRSELGMAVPDGDVDDARLGDLLDRPLRVCGMVINHGEPGGGPFWVCGQEDQLSRQIVEAAQIDRSDPSQVAILGAATHFNPVIMACALRDCHGRPHELAQFVDQGAAIVTGKVQNGQAIRILERPGLWNGGMAGWHTVFVELPESTFNPVKTVFDLLRPAHQP
jgi:hypothetical protein